MEALAILVFAGIEVIERTIIKLARLAPAKNKFADFILLRKNDLEIAETFIAGKSVYKSD